MDPLIYFLADLYPWWGLPLAFILAEVGNRHRRRGHRQKSFLYFAISIALVAVAIAYFVFNGFLHLRPAMMELEKQMSNK